MFRFALGASALVVLIGGFAAAAVAADAPACPPQHRSHVRHHVARRAPPEVVYSRRGPPAPRQTYNYEDNGRYDDGDAPRPGQRQLAYGQPPSWLDGYGTRPVVYGAYGTYNVYGGSSQVMPFGLPAAGGLAVYEPGGYGPGPSIIHVPNGY